MALVTCYAFMCDIIFLRVVILNKAIGFIFCLFGQVGQKHSHFKGKTSVILRQHIFFWSFPERCPAFLIISAYVWNGTAWACWRIHLWHSVMALPLTAFCSLWIYATIRSTIRERRSCVWLSNATSLSGLWVCVSALSMSFFLAWKFYGAPQVCIIIVMSASACQCMAVLPFGLYHPS